MRRVSLPARRPFALPLGLPARRPFHVCLACFGVGLALAESPPGVSLLLGALVATSLIWLRAPRLAACAAALVMAGAAAGDLRIAAIDRFAGRIHDGDYVSMRAHLLSPLRPSPFGASAEVGVIGGPPGAVQGGGDPAGARSSRARSTGADLAGARLLVRAPRWSPFPRSLAVGDEVLLSGTLRELRPRPSAAGPAVGGASAAGRSRAPPFDFAAYLRRRGVAAELMLDRVRPTGRRRGGLVGALDRMRDRAQRAVAAGMSTDHAALLRGMVLGQDEQIDRATRDDWRDAGLAHLLAVSGQNVMLLSALALPALMLAGAGLRVRLVVVAALIAIYVPLAGAGPSLQRAGVMGLAGIAAMAASRPASRWYALLLAATATLLWNPRAWTDPGWQLSFAAVAGILLLGVPLGRVLRRAVEELSPAEAHPGRADTVTKRAGAGRAIGRRLALALADGLAITASATVATAPLVAHHFGYLPLAGLPANLLVLPAVAPAMWIGMFKAALGQLPVAGAVELARAVGLLASLPVGCLAVLAERCADLPGGRLSVPLRAPAAVLTAYALLALVAAVVHRVLTPNIDHRLPLVASSWRAASTSRRRAALAAVVALIVVAGSVVLARPDPPTQLTVRFLDVGQGDAVLIQHPDGTAVLFDGGPPEGGVVRLLRRAGVHRLALVVATHASRDHHGGLPAVLRRFRVDTLLDGGDGAHDPSFAELAALADERGVRRVEAIAPLTITLADGDLVVDVLSPPPRPPGPPPEDPNPRAVVAVVRCRGFELFLSADAESEALLPLDLPDVDAMKVPHHGSSDPGLPQLLEQLEPELAAIEVGLHNTYGHPSPQALTALQHAQVATYRTDRHGTITLTPTDGAIRVATDR